MILTTLTIAAVAYLAIAFGVYRWTMGSNPNTMQKSMGCFVVVMALFWPLGLVLWVMKTIKDQKNKE